MKIKSIYFKGYYGFKNIGDDIFCVTADWICRHLWKDKKAVFIGDSLPTVSDKAKAITIRNSMLKRLYELYICIKADYIIYFGGSVLYKISGLTDLKYYLNKLPFFHSKLVTIGTSIGPFDNEADYLDIKTLLSKFKYVSLRDQSSLAIANKMDLEVKPSFSFDIAILLKEVFSSLRGNRRRHDNSKVKIAISLCHNERYIGGDVSLEKDREDSVFRFISSIIDSHDNIDELVFFEFNGNQLNGDIGIIQDFINRLGSKAKTRIVNYTSDTEGFCKEFSECDFLIGMRLHSGILAYVLQMPFMLVEYHEKCTEFLNTINHNCRYHIEDQQRNLDTYSYIMNKGFIPEIIELEHYKDIMLSELNKVQQIL